MKKIIGGLLMAMVFSVFGQAPVNDNFANRITLSGFNVTTTGSNTSATREAGEPMHWGGSARDLSVWWSWTSLSSGPVTIDLCGTAFDCVLAVYTGNQLSALNLVANNDDSSECGLQSRVQFNAVAGTTYQIAVAAFGGGSGSIVLNIAAENTGVSQALISAGSVWKYLDDGSDQSTAWRSSEFDDSGWSSGPARLGYQDGAVTTVSFGPNSDNKYITTYFRHSFTIESPITVSNLLLRVVRDDGVVVYVNGVEVFRDNMPGGAVNYLTQALSGIQDAAEFAFINASVPSNVFRVGTNVVAVEIHQNNGQSSDLGFDLELSIFNAYPFVNLLRPLNGAEVLLNSNYQLEAEAQDPGGSVARVEFFAGTNLIGASQVVPYRATWRPTQAGDYLVWAVVTDDLGLTNVSAQAAVKVVTNLTPLVAITNLVPGSRFTTPVNITLRSEASDADGTVSRVEYYNGTNFLGNANPDFSFTHNAVPVGNYQYYAVAIDNFGLRGTSAPVAIEVRGALPDNFVDRQTLTGTNVVWLGNNEGATRETGEPNHAGYFGTGSVWYQWTAPVSGRFNIMGTTPSFWMIMGVYTGTALNNLQLISGGYIGRNNPSGIALDAVAGTTYLIAIDSSGDERGDFELQIGRPATPANDNFANSAVLSSDVQYFSGTLIGATMQAGEPSHGQTNTTPKASVWWTWQSPATSNYIIRVSGPQGMVVDVYTGTSLGSLSRVSTQSGFSARFLATAGTTYRIVADTTSGMVGSVFLELQPFNPAPNDHFTNATVISGTSITAFGRNRGATKEPGEPNIDGYAGGASVWWRWTAPASSSVRLNFSADFFNHLFGVFTGSSISNLTRVTSVAFGNSLSFESVAGRVYYIMIDDYFGVGGENITLNLTVPTAIIPAGSVWRYLDNGSNQGTNWVNLNYIDTSWPVGTAELGYGDGDEATVIGFGGNSGNKHITYYFRRPFVLNNAHTFTELWFDHKIDDGAVFYLNGVRLFTFNLPAEVNYQTRANTDYEQTTFDGPVNIDPALLRNGTNVFAVEVHQNSPTSSDISFNLRLVGVTTNAPPVVSITNPVQNASYPANANVTINAAATAFNGTISRVEFFRDDVLIGQDTTPPYSITWSNVSAGTYNLTARAHASTGLSGVSAAVTINVGILGPLVLRGSTWKYLDDGSDQGTSWKEPGFDDLGWFSGAAELGYGDGDEATVVRFGPNSGNKYPTTYFRQTFNVFDPASITNLAILVKRDDGVVVYVNGTEVFRDNMPAGTVGYRTYASSSQEGNTFIQASINPFLLREGANVVAAEIHQSDGGSSDISFDLEMIGNSATIQNRPPTFSIQSPAPLSSFFINEPITFNVDANDPDGIITSVGLYYQNRLVAEDTTFPFQPQWTTNVAGNYSINVRIRDNNGAIVTQTIPITLNDPVPTLNDNFVDSIRLVNSGTYTGSTMTATKEIGEPNHAGNSGGKSAWWHWTSDTNGVVIVLTGGSTFDTLLAVYTGNAVNSLTHIASNDNDPRGGTHSRVSFNAVQGNTYYFAVDGAGGAGGLVTLTLGNNPPMIQSVSPIAGVIGSLTNIVVSFSRPVIGVDAGDLLVNGVPALSVSGSATTYEFRFTQPEFGPVLISWRVDHGIQDTAQPPNPFDHQDASANWQYSLRDINPPFAARIRPIPGATVKNLNSITINFSEAVLGVDAADLLFNGIPALSVSGTGAGPYEFRAPILQAGAVNVSWRANHGIMDFAPNGNPLVLSNWNYTIAPTQLENVLINEIMFNPLGGGPAAEFVELLNNSTNAINLAGWRFSKGISFVFPNVVVQPGNYLVVAADLTTFQVNYPTVQNVIGNWEGTLSNGGEEIEIENALGENIDSVEYSDEGDWAQRERWTVDPNGWVWVSQADGLGKSMELRNRNLPGNNGQNWSASIGNGGTPGVVNSSASSDVPPLILDVSHHPIIPRSSDQITITARIADEDGGAEVLLFVRNHSSLTPGPFSSLVMRDDGMNADGVAGDGVYGVTLPAQTNRTVLEFYVQAQDDAAQVRTWPAPAKLSNGTLSQAANALILVDDAVYTGNQPIVHLVMTGTERETLRVLSRNSDAQMNGTLLTVDGTESLVRHNVGIRYRGAGSRGANPPNYRVNIPKDNRWKDLSEINLNSQFGHVQVAGSALSLQSGLPAAEARAIQIRVNGVNIAGSGSGQLGSYALVIPIGAEWAERMFPEDPNGNVYRASTGNHSAGLGYHGTVPQNYINAGYFKSSNGSEDDWSDLIQLTYTLSQNTSDPQFVQQLPVVANISEWIKYFAVLSLMEYSETSIGSGRGDDYALYRGIIDPRFQIIAHDFDTILGVGQGSGDPFLVNESIFKAADSGNIPAVGRFFSHPDVIPLYYAELKKQALTTFSAQNLNPLLDQLLGSYVPQNTLNTMKNFAAARVAYVLSQIPEGLTVQTTLSPNQGYYFTTSPTAVLTGVSDVIRTRKILVNGIEANWTPRGGNWSGNAALNPGLNRVLIQALDANNTPFLAASIEIWYDDGSTRSVFGTITSNTTWSAALGPYSIGGNITVPAGVTLTIEPGTTLYFTAGTSISVNGRLLAEGTAERRIRMGRVPGSANTWNGIAFNNSTNENRLVNVDIQYASGNDAIRAVNSTIYVEGATWSGTTRTIIDLNNSSAIIRNSVFPSIVNNETIHGTGMPINGHVIIESNYFGGTTGYSDIIDFTGGRRPGPIIQVLNNVFDGGSDDAIDLDGTDAHIEGNVFRNIHQDAPRDSASFAIATDNNSEITVVRNLFLNNDHAVLLKNGAFLTAQNNTIVGSAIAAIAFDETNRVVDPGRGAFLEGNILWNNAALFQHLYINDSVEEDTDLTVHYSLLQGTNWPGTGNISADPLFENITSGQYTLRAGSPAKGVGPNGLDMGAFVQGGASISGEPASSTPANSARLAIAGPGITHYRYRLNNGEYSSEMSITNHLVITNLAPGFYTIYVIGKNSAGVWQSMPTASRSWKVDPNASPIIINEILARNNSISVGTQFPDLIELYNQGTVSLDLGGSYISDDPNNPYKFRFPLGTTVGAGQYLVLVADSGNGPGIRVGFSLSAEGEIVVLTDPDGRPMDSITFGQQLQNFSIGRFDGGQWALAIPTIGQRNMPSDVGAPQSVKINEWLAAGNLYGPDFIELFNMSPYPVDLGGWYLTDNPIGRPAAHRIAPLTFMGPGSFAVFLADGESQLGGNHLSFKLGAEIGMIGLLDPAFNIIDQVSYGPQSTDISQGRSPSGSSVFAYFPQPTPGAHPPITGGSGNNVVLNEILANNISYLEEIGSPDFVELHNPTSNSIDLSDMSLTDSTDDPRRWVFPNGAQIAAGDYYVVYLDGLRPSSAVNTGFGLSASGDGVHLFDSPARGGLPIDSLSFGIQAADYSLGRVTPTTNLWVLGTPTPGSLNLEAQLGDASNLTINEWLADPAPGEDDWFEVYNPNPQPVALSGLYLTDDLSTPAGRAKHQIPPLSFIGVGVNGYQQFIADGMLANGKNHVNFSLRGGGEALGIYAAGDIRIDSISFGAQQEGVSEGRLPDGTTNVVRFAASQSPAASNYLPLTEVVVSEVLANANLPLEDAIELQNISTQPIDVSGWFLSDTAGMLNKFRLPNGTIIPPGGFKVFYEYQFNSGTNTVTSFSLNPLINSQVWLSQADASGELTGYRNSVRFGPSQRGISMGRYQSSVGVQFVGLSRTTFGVNDPASVESFRTGQGASNAPALVGPVVISEIMYAPPAIGGVEAQVDEYIELKNISSSAVALFDPIHPTNTWRIRDAVDFNFPAGITLQPGGYLVIAAFDPVGNPGALAAFRARFGITTNVTILGPFSGRLDNNGENIELYAPAVPALGLVPYVEADKVRYSPLAPWPTSAAGSGNSLHRATDEAFGNDPVSWVGGLPTPGSAPAADSDSDGLPDDWEIANGLNPNSNSDANVDGDGDGMSNWQEFIAGTDPRNSASALAFSSASISVGDDFQFSFIAAAGKSYAIEYRESLSTGSWQRLQFVPAGQGGPITITDSNGSKDRFYRIVTPATP